MVGNIECAGDKTISGKSISRKSSTNLSSLFGHEVLLILVSSFHSSTTTCHGKSEWLMQDWISLFILFVVFTVILSCVLNDVHLIRDAEIVRKQDVIHIYIVNMHTHTHTYIYTL